MTIYVETKNALKQEIKSIKESYSFLKLRYINFNYRNYYLNNGVMEIVQAMTGYNFHEDPFACYLYNEGKLKSLKNPEVAFFNAVNDKCQHICLLANSDSYSYYFKVYFQYLGFTNNQLVDHILSQMKQLKLSRSVSAVMTTSYAWIFNYQCSSSEEFSGPDYLRGIHDKTGYITNYLSFVSDDRSLEYHITECLRFFNIISMERYEVKEIFSRLLSKYIFDENFIINNIKNIIDFDFDVDQDTDVEAIIYNQLNDLVTFNLGFRITNNISKVVKRLTDDKINQKMIKGITNKEDDIFINVMPNTEHLLDELEMNYNTESVNDR